ncbi:MAG: succinate dehydrogenase/fumarate reductase iron-sulfur subunit [Sandaracinaceae bacterium]|nr:succinate dehydrogenase/fumarate reductase iron-sulfur subunit [Sandaracinaceae bacterium]
MSDDTIDLRLHVWRQRGPGDEGRFADYSKYAKRISTHASFLEMLDVVNERLAADGERPIAFDHDCREGICGMCGAVINGVPHGHRTLTTTCQLHMREFQNGAEVFVEPFRATAFPVIEDLMVDRSSFDTIVQAGGYVSVRTGAAPDANEIPVPKQIADRAMDAAACIGCGACVAACPNASASLFLSAKLAHLNLLPQGQPERYRRTRAMLAAHDDAGFGGCTNHRECEAACPKGISTDFIARMNRDVIVASLTDKDGNLI